MENHPPPPKKTRAACFKSKLPEPESLPAVASVKASWSQEINEALTEALPRYRGGPGDFASVLSECERVCVCVCVDHLKRCKTSMSYFCWMLSDYGFVDVESEFFSRGHAAITRMPTKLCVMVEAGTDHPGVPANVNPVELLTKLLHFVVA